MRDLQTLIWIAEYLAPEDEHPDVVMLEYFDGREVGRGVAPGVR